MSIWQSIDAHSGVEVRAIHDRTGDANYTGEGPEDAWLDVAFNGSHHPRLRLLVQSDGHLDEQLLLTPTAARLLAGRLMRGAAESERRHGT